MKLFRRNFVFIFFMVISFKFYICSSYFNKMIEYEQLDPNSKNIDTSNDQLSLMRVNIDNESENISYSNKNILIEKNSKKKSDKKSKSFKDLEEIKISAAGHSGENDDFKYFENKSEIEGESKKLLEENIKKISEKKLDESYNKQESLKEVDDSSYMINNIEDTRDKDELYISSLKTLNKAIKSKTKVNSKKIKEISGKNKTKGLSNSLINSNTSSTQSKSISSKSPSKDDKHDINSKNKLIQSIKSEKNLEKKHLEYEIINKKLPLFSEMMKKKYSNDDHGKIVVNDKLNKKEINLINEYFSKLDLNKLKGDSDLFKLKETLPSNSEPKLKTQPKNIPHKSEKVQKEHSQINIRKETSTSKNNYGNSFKKNTDINIPPKNPKKNENESYLHEDVITKAKKVMKSDLIKDVTKNNTETNKKPNKTASDDSFKFKIKGLLKGTIYEHKKKKLTFNNTVNTNQNKNESKNINEKKVINQESNNKNTSADNYNIEDDHPQVSEIDKFENYLRNIGVATTRVKSQQDDLNDLFDKMKKRSANQEKETKKNESAPPKIEKKENNTNISEKKVIKEVQSPSSSKKIKTNTTKQIQKHVKFSKKEKVVSKNSSKIKVENLKNKRKTDESKKPNKIKITKRAHLKEEVNSKKTSDTSDQQKKLSGKDDLSNLPIEHVIINKELNLGTNNFNSYFKFDLMNNQKNSQEKEINPTKNLTIEERLLDKINHKLNEHPQISEPPKKKPLLRRYENPQVVSKNIQQELKKEMKFKIDTSVFNNFLSKLRKSVPDDLIPKPKPQPTLKEFYEDSNKIKKNPNLFSNFIELPKIFQEIQKEKEENEKPVNLNSIFKEEFQAFVQKTRE